MSSKAARRAIHKEASEASRHGRPGRTTINEEKETTGGGQWPKWVIVVVLVVLLSGMVLPAFITPTLKHK